MAKPARQSQHVLTSLRGLPSPTRWPNQQQSPEQDSESARGPTAHCTGLRELRHLFGKNAIFLCGGINTVLGEETHYRLG